MLYHFLTSHSSLNPLQSASTPTALGLLPFGRILQTHPSRRLLDRGPTARTAHRAFFACLFLPSTPLSPSPSPRPASPPKNVLSSPTVTSLTQAPSIPHPGNAAAASPHAAAPTPNWFRVFTVYFLPLQGLGPGVVLGMNCGDYDRPSQGLWLLSVHFPPSLAGFQSGCRVGKRCVPSSHNYVKITAKL